jgi:hypothetical protein
MVGVKPAEQAGNDLEVGVVAVTPRPGAALPGGMVGRLLGCVDDQQRRPEHW